jgi:hypothetical protein
MYMHKGETKRLPDAASTTWHASLDAIPWGEGCGHLLMECQAKAFEKYVQTFNNRSTDS